MGRLGYLRNTLALSAQYSGGIYRRIVIKLSIMIIHTMRSMYYILYGGYCQ